MVWRDDEYPLMAEDLPKKSLKKARDSMREYGATVTDRLDSAIATAAETKLKTSSTLGTRLSAARREMALKDIAPAVKDIPWSVERMANRKMYFIKSGVERSREEGTTLRGAGWYF